MLRFALVLAALAAGLTAPALAAADPLLDRLRADAAAADPADVAFESVVTATGPRKDESRVTVERWDGRVWTLVSINGKAPSTAEADKFRRQKADERNIPGYGRLATYLSGTVEKRTDAAGNTVYFIPELPKGSFILWGDNSRHFSGEALVAQSPAGPYIKRFRAWVREPFRMRVVIKVERFDLVNDYAVDDGRRVLVRQQSDSNGALLGQTGTMRIDSQFSAYRASGAGVEAAAR